MHSLLELFAERLGAGLRQRSLTSPSKWAKSCRVMGAPFPGPWTFKYHPWLEEMHDSKAEVNIGQKAAQQGFTECVLNITFYKIDVEGIDCLYVLPSKTPDASNFSAARFDAALELSHHLSHLFSSVKNVGHKRAGASNLYIRGSKSKSGLKSVPVGFIVMDELDEMNQSNIGFAFERASGQKSKQIWMISNPTIHYEGINKEYLLSSQESYFFKCPACSRYTTLSFPESIEITGEHLDDPNLVLSHLKCKECNARLEHNTKHEWLSPNPNSNSGKNNKGATWVAEYPDRKNRRGFYINQLYSATVSPYELAKAYHLALLDPTNEQIFWNQKIGVPHIVEGSKVTDVQFEECKGTYLNGEAGLYKNLLITMGIDVGKFIHYEIDAWKLGRHSGLDLNIGSHPRILQVGKVQHFEELDIIMKDYQVNFAVIDASPERRKAFEFANRFWGHVKMCFYGSGIHSKRIQEKKYSGSDDNEPTITVDRTSWLDLSIGRFKNKGITIPQNTPIEYKQQIQALVRQYDKDKEGNPVGRYLHGTKPDHYAHARNYSEIALAFAASVSQSYSINARI